ncbi:MAG: GAF domain-containing protein, partial [Anaerolineae bacterium]|nr:GAF domain-containing protein [Anaerolineae bacterium]
MENMTRLILCFLIATVALILFAGYVEMRVMERLCAPAPDRCAADIGGFFAEIRRLLIGTLVASGSIGALLRVSRMREHGKAPASLAPAAPAGDLDAEERNLLRNVIDSVPDCIYVKDLESRFVLYNRATVELLGIAEDEVAAVAGRSSFEVYDDPDLAAKATADEQEVIESGVLLETEELMPGKDGNLRWLRTTKMPWRDPHGHTVGTIGISHDITERKHLERRLKRRLRETLLLNRVVAAATSVMAVEDVLTTTCRELAHALDLPQTAFALMDDGKKSLTVVAEYVTEARPSTRGIRIPIEGNLATQYVLESRKPLVIPNVPEDERMGDLGRAMARRGTVSLLIVPLLVRGQVLGTLGLNATAPREFSEDDVALVQNVAAAISQSLDSKRLYEVLEKELIERINAEEALRRQNEYLAALHDTALGLMRRLDLDDLLGALVARAAQLFGTSNGFIYLVAPGGEVLERKVNQGVFAQTKDLPQLKPGVGLSGKIWQTGQQLVINHYDAWPGRSPNFAYGQIRAIMGAPLKSEAEVLGVIGIAHGYEISETFGEAEVELLSRFAQLAAISLDNARLFAAEHDAREQAETLRAATQELFEAERLGRVELALAISEAQEARAAAEAASQSKSAFLANVSHELRTPLTSVLGFAKIIKKRLNDVILPVVGTEDRKVKRAVDQVKTNIEIIVAEGERLTGLINDVLDLAKIEAGKIEWQMQPVVMRHVIDRSAAATLPLFD